MAPLNPPPGCVFSTRCPYATDRCRTERPALRLLDERLVACHYAERFLDSGPLDADRTAGLQAMQP